MEKGSILATLLGVVSSVIDLMIVNTVVTTTGGLLNNVGSADLATKGQSIYKMYMICTIISVICNVLGLIPLINIIAGVVAFVVAIVLIVAWVRYMIYLSKSSSALGA